MSRKNFNVGGRSCRYFKDSSWPRVLKAIFVTDTVRPMAEYPDRIEILSVAPLLAEAIQRIHTAGSISQLFIE